MKVPALSPIIKRLAITTPVFLLSILQPAWTNDLEHWKEARSGSVVGRVIEAQTGTFLADAAVSLFRQPGRRHGSAGDGWQITEFEVRSREDGSFEFEGLPAGSYTVFAELPGYLKSGMWAGPQVVTVLPAERGRSLVVKLYPESAIQGSVLNGAGRGIEGAKVRAFAEFRGTLREVASGSADGSGEFVVRQLPPGRYVLLAELPVLPAARAPTYFPSSLTASRAVPIKVPLGGGVTGIRIILRQDPARRIRGSVDDFRGVLGDQGATVYLVPRSDSGTDLMALARRTSLGGDRSFEFGGIPPGLYKIQLVREQPDPRVLATQDVAVGSADVDGLGLYPEPPVSLRGRATVAGHANRDLSSVRVGFLGLPVAAGFASSADALVGRDGRFVAEDLEPASYALQVQAPPDLYVERVLIGGRPIAGEVLDLAGGVRGDLDIKLRDGAARIKGAVLETGSSSLERAGRTCVAILYPAGTGPGDGGRRVASVVGSRFEFGGVPPGVYKIFATNRFDPDLFGEPVFLAQISGAVRTVKIRRYERRHLDLRLISVGQVEAAARRAGFAEI